MRGLTRGEACLKGNLVLFWIIVVLGLAATIGLGALAWALANQPTVRVASTDLEAAQATAVYREISLAVGRTPDAPLEIPAESFRALPTSIAEFQNIPPTFTPEAAPSKLFGDPALVLGEATWIDSFELGGSQVRDPLSCARGAVERGRLRVTGSGGPLEFCTLLLQPESRDYYLEVSMEPVGQCSGGEFGLFFRGARDGSGLYFGQTCDGRYQLIHREPGRGGLLFFGTAPGSEVQPADPTNRIGVLVRGDRVAVYANGTLLGEVANEVAPFGASFGLFTRASDGQAVSVEFDDLTFWDFSE